MVSITMDEEFVVHDIKVIEGEKGLFIAMPSKKTADGEYRDVAASNQLWHKRADSEHNSQKIRRSYAGRFPGDSIGFDIRERYNTRDQVTKERSHYFTNIVS